MSSMRGVEAVAGLALVLAVFYDLFPVSYTHLTLPTICSV